MSDDTDLRERLCRWAKSMFDRGLTGGSSGNITARTDAGFLATPTNSCLGFLDPAALSELDASGAHTGGPAPTKEVPLHMAIYAARPSAGAVVHLHSTYATLLSCLADTDPEDAIPPLTPYVVMRVGRVPVLPYVAPGDPAIAPLIREKAAGLRRPPARQPRPGRRRRHPRSRGLRRRGARGDRQARRPRPHPAHPPPRQGDGRPPAPTRARPRWP